MHTKIRTIIAASVASPCWNAHVRGCGHVSARAGRRTCPRTSASGSCCERCASARASTPLLPVTCTSFQKTTSLLRRGWRRLRRATRAWVRNLVVHACVSPSGCCAVDVWNAFLHTCVERSLRESAVSHPFRILTCLDRTAAALSNIYGVRESFPGELTTIARMGSGSACRSLYGGFVRWEAGVRPDGTDSIGVQVAPASHWPELEVIIMVVSAHKKDTSSTDGMMTSVLTSDLLKVREQCMRTVTVGGALWCDETSVRVGGLAVGVVVKLHCPFVSVASVAHAPAPWHARVPELHECGVLGGVLCGRCSTVPRRSSPVDWRRSRRRTWSATSRPLAASRCRTATSSTRAALTRTHPSST